MSKVNILHLSDLHFGNNPSKKTKGEEEKTRSKVLNKLLDKLKSLDNTWKPDIIVISGDVGASGNVEDYKKAWEWINRLLDLLNLKSTRLVISAGNHDKNIQDKASRLVPKSCKEADELIETESLKTYFNAFESFKVDNEILPLQFNSSFNYLFGHKQVLGLQFIVLNSAWFSTGRALNDEKKMFIGVPHIKSLIEEGILNPLDTNMGIIVSVLHHPPEWLHQCEQDRYENRPPPYVNLAKNCDIIFSGHTHGEEIFEPDKKYEGAFLFKTGAVYNSETHIFTCEILRIDTKNRVADRLKLDFSKETELWVDKVDEKNYIFSNDISRLKQHSKNIQNQIIDTIGINCKVQRSNILTKMNEKILNHDIIFITGEAMVGKSVILKDIASNLNQNSYLFFNAGRFKFPNLDQYLKSINIINEFKKILNSFNAEDGIYILIDDVERIRESEDKLTVFKDIITSIFSLNLESGRNDWKLILSCRSEYFQNVSNIVDQLSKDLNLIKTNNTIQPFNDEELDQVINSFPKLKSLIQQPHLEKIIKIPKLLDLLTFKNFILKEGEISQDFKYSYYTETYLMKQFWSQIVRNNEQMLPFNLNPEERDRFLQKIASHILLNSTPYLIGEEDNVQLYQSLISERILKRNGDQLSFTHDLFEEWVLVRSMISKPDIVRDFIIVFNDSQRINRSFQLYSRYLVEISVNPKLWKSKYDCIKENIEINPIWKQDFIYGILKSEVLIEILPILKDCLLTDDNKVLKELFKLLQIKGVIFEEDLSPDIKIWLPIISYVTNNLFSELFDKSLLLFTEIVKKWLSKFYIQFQEFSNLILERFIEFTETKIISEDSFDDLSYEKESNLKKNILFIILWGLLYKPKETVLFLDKVIESKKSRPIFEKVLFDKYGYMFLCNHVPEYALKVLKLYIIKKKEIPERIDRYEDPLSSHGFFKYIYYEIKAPFYNFLNYHEDHGLNLIHEVINHATKIWINTDQPIYYGPFFNSISEHRTPLPQKIQLSDKVVEVWGDDVVYSWFMPLGMGPRVVRFALTALEKWIFEQILKNNRDPSEIITKVIKNTKSFSVVAVSIISILHLFSECTKNQIDINYDDLIKAIQPVIEKPAFWSLDLTRSIKYGIGLGDYRSQNIEFFFHFIKFYLRDNDLKKELFSKIGQFSEDIFIFFEEEMSCKPLLIDRLAHMRRLVEQTKDENWHPLEINGQSALQFVLPKELQNDVEKDFYEEKFTLLPILNWIYSSFVAGEISPRYNPENLLIYMEKLVKKDEEVQRPIAFTDLSADRAEVLTGFFALLIIYGWEFLQKNKLEKRAKDIILRAVKRSQALGYNESSVSLYTMGYKRSAARAVPFLFQRYPKERKIKKAIIKLIKYNNNQVRNFLFKYLALIWEKNHKMIWKWIQILFKESLKRAIIKKDRYYIINKFIQKDHGFSPRVQFENVKKITLMKLYIKRSFEISSIGIINKNLKDLDSEEVDLDFFCSVLHIIPQGSKIVELLPDNKIFSFLEDILLFTIKVDIFNKIKYKENKIKYHDQNPNFHFYEKWGNKALSVIGNAVLFLELDKVKNYFIKPILSVNKNSENVLKVFLREFIIVSNQLHNEERFIDIWGIFADHIFKSLLDKEKISFEVVYFIFFQDNYGHILKKDFELETSIKQLNRVIKKFLNHTTYYYPILRLVNELKNPILYTTVISLLYERLKSFSFNEERHTRLRRELYILIESFWTTFQGEIRNEQNQIRKIEFLCEILIDWGELQAGKLLDMIKNQ